MTQPAFPLPVPGAPVALPPVASPQPYLDTSGAAIQPPVLPSPGTLEAPATPVPSPVGGVPFGGGTPVGSLTSTPRQATADFLNTNDSKKDLEKEQGDVESAGLARLADKQLEAAAEKQQQSQDYQDLLQANLVKYEDAHKQTQAAYDEYRKKAGSLKDPSQQFFEDHGQGSRIVSALAAFASGLGSGLQGHGGNPFVDYLQKQIEGNYQAHKQNIEDLYNSSVASGKIEDNVENHNRFMQDAKLHSFELQSAHISHELEAIKSSTQSPIAKITAQKAQLALDQEASAARQALAAKEAAAAAARSAAERAMQKEIREAYTKALENHKDLSPEDARAQATQDVFRLGYNRSQLAPLFEANGVTTDPKTGEYVFPKSTTPAGPSEPTFDEAGKLVVPSKDPVTGKQYKPEERQKIADEARERTVVVDGKPALAINKKAAEEFKVFNDADLEAQRLGKILQAAFKSGDKGAYDQARNEYIELAPKLYGFTRGPSAAQAGETGGGKDGGEDAKGTVAGQIPEFHVLTALGVPLSQGVQKYANSNPFHATNSPAGQAHAKLDGLDATLENLRKTAREGTFSQPQAEVAKPAKPKSVADLAASFGGKPVR